MKQSKTKTLQNDNHLIYIMDVLDKSHIPVKAFFPPVEEPAGITFRTLNRTVFDNGLKIEEQNKNQNKHKWS